MTRRRLLAALLAVGLATLPDLGRAAEERALAMEELIDQAEEIVVGEVTRSEARFEGAVIVTESRVDVAEALKGSPPRSVSILQLGGTAVHPRLGAPVSMDASSHVSLRTGERVVLFLRRRPGGAAEIVGTHQGKLEVSEAPARPAPPGLPPAAEPRLATGPKELRVRRAAEGLRARAEDMTLQQLRERVRTREAERRTGGRP
jgi:hypothetical protein